MLMQASGGKVEVVGTTHATTGVRRLVKSVVRGLKACQVTGRPTTLNGSQAEGTAVIAYQQMRSFTMLSSVTMLVTVVGAPLLGIRAMDSCRAA